MLQQFTKRQITRELRNSGNVMLVVCSITSRYLIVIGSVVFKVGVFLRGGINEKFDGKFDFIS